MYYITLLVYDVVNVSLGLSHDFSTKCIGYNTICYGALGFACIHVTALMHLSWYCDKYTSPRNRD